MTEGATHLACDEVLVVHKSQDESIELPALRNPDSNKSNQQVSYMSLGHFMIRLIPSSFLP